MASNFINEIAAKFKVLFGRNNMSVCGESREKRGNVGKVFGKVWLKGELDARSFSWCRPFFVSMKAKLLTDQQSTWEFCH